MNKCLHVSWYYVSVLHTFAVSFFETIHTVIFVVSILQHFRFQAGSLAGLAQRCIFPWHHREILICSKNDLKNLSVNEKNWVRSL